MALRLEWVRYGRPAAEALARAIAKAKAGEPLAPVGVVVPSNHVGVATRRLLGSGELGRVCEQGTGLAAVSFQTVWQMAELLGARALARQGRRPVSTPALAAAYRSALAEAPGLFAAVAEHPATEAALVNAHRELRDLSGPALGRLARRSERAAQVVRLHLLVRDLLRGRLYDEEDLIEAAIATLDERGEVALRGSTVVYLPQRLSRHAAMLLTAVARHQDCAVLAGTTGEPAADAETLTSLRRLVPDLGPAEPAAALASVSVGTTRLVTTSDSDEEVRVAVRAVLDAARAGSPLERIALLYPSPEPYARLVHEQLEAAGIPFNGAAAVPLAARVAGRTLLGLLGLARGELRREEVFTWLAGAPLHHRGDPVPVAAWERLSREAGVVASRSHWDEALRGFAEEAERVAASAEADPDQPPWKAERRRADAARARSLRELVLTLVDELAGAGATPRSWHRHASWSIQLLRELLPAHERARWPLAEQQAAERVERAIGRLGGLPGSAGLEVFARALALELDGEPGRVGRFGEGVLVGPLGFGLGLDLDLLVVVGMAEGSLPASPTDDSLLPDREREATGGELALRAGHVDRQHQALLAALAAASRHLLVIPRGDLRRSSERVPSRWAIEIASTLAGRPLPSDELLSTKAPWIEHVASFDAGLRGLAFPGSAQEHRLRALLATGPAPRPTALGDELLTASASVLSARRSTRFTRFDGNCSGLDIPSPTSETTSATRLERWATCPFAYFLEEVLGVEEIDNPEDRLRIAPQDRGSLVHEILERFLADVLSRPAHDQPGPTEPWTRADRDLLLAHAEEVCARYERHGRVGRPIFWAQDRRRLLADLERFLAEDDAYRASARSRPVAAELSFGLPGASLGPVALRLPDGRSVHFSGRADRLDLTEEGIAEVLDYKTGRSIDDAALRADDPADRGRRLQLPVYALAATARLGRGLPVRAAYWFTSAQGGFRRIGYLVTPELLDQVGETVLRIARGIEAGIFPSLPPSGDGRGYRRCACCDPDGLGVSDLRRQLERKRNDPALAGLVGPEEAAPVGPGSAAETDAGR